MINKSLLKRMSAISLAAMMIFSLAACNNSSDSAKTTNTTKSSDSADHLGAYKDTITVKLGRVTSSNSKLPKGDTYENNAYTRLVKDRLNVTVKDAFEANGDDYTRQVALAIASGELPDMMRVDSKQDLKQLAENDLIADLTDVYKKYATDNIKKIYDSYDGRALGNATIDGKLMGLPGTSPDSAPCEIWIRQDWLDELGLKVDTDGNGTVTLAELEKIAEAFIKNDPGKTGNPVGIPFVNSLNTTEYGATAFTMKGVASVFNAFPQYWLKGEDGSITYGSTTEGTKQALGVLADWYKKGIVDPQFGTRTWDDIMALVTKGQTGIVFGPWHIPDWGLSNLRTANNKAKFSAYTLEDAKGKVNVAHGNPSSSFYVVRKDYAHPELAIKILNLFYDVMANSKDIEKDMPEVAKYKVADVDGSTRPFNIELNSNTSLLDDYSDMYNAVNGKITIDKVRTSESKANVPMIKKYMEDQNDTQVSDWSKYHSRMLGVALIDKLTKANKFNWITPINTGTTKTMEKAGANLSKLEQEAFIKIVTGAKPLSSFDTFVSEWKKQGGDEITKEIKDQLANSK